MSAPLTWSLRSAHALLPTAARLSFRPSKLHLVVESTSIRWPPCWRPSSPTPPFHLATGPAQRYPPGPAQRYPPGPARTPWRSARTRPESRTRSGIYCRAYESRGMSYLRYADRGVTAVLSATRGFRILTQFLAQPSPARPPPPNPGWLRAGRKKAPASTAFKVFLSR